MQWSSGEPGSALNPDHGISDAFGQVFTSYTVGSRNSFQHVFASIPHDTLEYLILGTDDPYRSPNISRATGPPPRLMSCSVSS